MFLTVKFLFLLYCSNLSSRTSAAESNSLREIFRDDFSSSNRQPSSYRWRTVSTNRSAQDTKYNAEADDIYVQDDSLNLSASNETGCLLAETSGKFHFKYGEVEARLRVPRGCLFFTLRLVPDRCSQGVKCTASFLDTYPRMFVIQVRSDGNSFVRSEYYGGYLYENVTLPNQNSLLDFHVYRMVWTNTSLTWYIDNQKVQQTSATEGQIGHSFSRLEFSLCVEVGECRQKYRTVRTIFPAVLEIDYVVVRQDNPYREPHLLFLVDFSKTASLAYLQDKFVYGIVSNNFTSLPVTYLNVVDGSLQLSCIDDSMLKSQYVVVLQTVGYFDFLYGELQFRARLPSVIGVNAPLAMIGLRNYLCVPGACGTGESAPEVSLRQTLERPFDNEIQLAYNSPLSPGITLKPSTPLREKIDLSAQFHTFNISWTPSSLVWSVDDEIVFVERDIRRIPSVRMYFFFTMSCDPSAEDSSRSLQIEFVSVRQSKVVPEQQEQSTNYTLQKQEQITEKGGWGVWKYGTLFGVSGCLGLFSICIWLIVKLRRQRERLGWRTRDGNTIRLQRSIPPENEYLGRVLSVPSCADIFIIPPENLARSDTVLGKGEHGVVFLGTATGLYGKSSPIVVAVKTLISTGQDSSVDSSFLKELDVLAKCGHHLNIVNLLGVVVKGRPSLLIEYCQFGSLLGYLREHRPPFFFSHIDFDGNILPFDLLEYEKENDRLRSRMKKETVDQALLSSKDLVNFAYQAARGMEYLASRSIIHRDLAARNVLVDKSKIIKISDFGMARLTEGQYVLQDGSIPLPVRWMSPSAIQTKIFDQSTDIWSYGVLLWEIFSLGQLPYGERKIGGNVDGFVQEITDGMRMVRPELCPNDMYEVMLLCWVLSLDQAATTFEMLKNRLETIITQEVGDYYTTLDAPYEKFNKEHDGKHSSDVLSDQLSSITEGPIETCEDDSTCSESKTRI